MSTGIQKVGVLGAGQMGNGIAQVLAAHGFSVRMVDVSQAALDKGLATVASSCDRLIKKEAMTEAQKKELLSRIASSVKVEDFRDCDCVIEAVAENVELKLKIFRQLDEICPKHALLCTNT